MADTLADAAPPGLRMMPLFFSPTVDVGLIWGNTMANNDIKAAEQTYSGFINMAKWGTAACVVIAAFVVLIIS